MSSDRPASPEVTSASTDVDVVKRFLVGSWIALGSVAVGLLASPLANVSLGGAHLKAKTQREQAQRTQTQKTLRIKAQPHRAGVHPAIGGPVISGPGISEPVISGPGISEPVISEPAFGSPVAGSPGFGLPWQEGSAVEIWKIDTRCAPADRFHQNAFSRFRVYVQAAGLPTKGCCPGKLRWRASSLEALRASSLGLIPTCFFVHGNNTTADQADDLGRLAARQFGRYVPKGQFVRLVLWSWPSERQVVLPRKDLLLKAERADVQGLYLASLIRQFPPSVPIGILGYSYGARVSSAALHLLGGGSVQGRFLSPGSIPRQPRLLPDYPVRQPQGPSVLSQQHIDPRKSSVLQSASSSLAASQHMASQHTATRHTATRHTASRSPAAQHLAGEHLTGHVPGRQGADLRRSGEHLSLVARAGRQRYPVVLLAAAEPNDWLLPGKQFGRALRLVERLLVTTNRLDPVLSRFNLLDRSVMEEALGAKGFSGRPRLGSGLTPQELPVARLIGARHSSTYYLESEPLMRQVVPFLVSGKGPFRLLERSGLTH